MPYKDPKAQKEYFQKYNIKHRTRITARRYGLTLDQYNKLLIAQHGVCAICLKPETYIHPASKKVSPLAIDHDKITNKVRGLLCMNCNTAVGLLGDSIERALALALYLERSK